jgi:alpha-tubulin suppressor-like RCC1 family protein
MNLAPSYSSLSCHIILYNQQGELWGWGDNVTGSLGTGDTELWKEPRRVKLDEELVQFASGWNHNLALTKDGRLFVWGNNNWGQLGLGDGQNRSTPVPLEMPNSLPVTSIACGRDCSFAVTSDGTLFGWGVDQYGQVTAGSDSQDGTDSPKKVPLESKVTKVWAGRDHVLVKTEEGEVVVWGNNYSWQCGVDSGNRVPPTKLENFNFSEIFPGGGHNLMIDSKDMVWGWGRNSMNQLGIGEDEPKAASPREILSEPVQTAAVGLDHNLVLTKKGEVVGWGRATTGRLGVMAPGEPNMDPTKIKFPTESPVVFLFCGAHCSAVGTLDGSLFVLGQKLDTKSSNVYPALIKNFKIQLPGKIQRLWEEIMVWLFLGFIDDNSILFQLPKEILLNFVHVIFGRI